MKTPAGSFFYPLPVSKNGINCSRPLKKILVKKNVLPFILLALIAANESFAQKEKPAQGIIKTDATLKNKKKATDKKELQIITAEKVMDMEMPEGGVNGASVAFHPKEKLYYAAQA